MTDTPPPPLDVEEVRRRQRSRSNVTGLVLIGLAMLFFGITIAKMGLAQ